MTTKNEKLLEEIRTLMADVGQPVAPSDQSIPRWKDGTPKLLKDRIPFLEEKLDLERMASVDGFPVDPDYHAAHLDDWGKLIALRTRHENEERAAAAEQRNRDQAKAREEYEAKRIADEKAAGQQQQDALDVKVDEWYRTGGASPQPTR